MNQNMAHQLAPTVGPTNSSGSINHDETRSPPLNLQGQPRRFSDKYQQSLIARMNRGKEPVTLVSPEGSATSVGSPVATVPPRESGQLILGIRQGGGKTLGGPKCGPQEEGPCDLFLASPSENHCVSIPNGIGTPSHMSPDPYEGRNIPVKSGSEEECLPPRKRPYCKGQIGEHAPLGAPNQGFPSGLPCNNEHLGSPWDRELSLMELPNKFGISRLPRYNGTSNPREHIRSHILHILLYSADARIYARTFP